MGDDHNLLVISDLHLGEDLGPDSTTSVHVDETEGALVRFLHHYTTSRLDGLPWKLVVNGDMVDFLSVHVDAGDDGSDDDKAWGVGTSEVASQAKFERVLLRHQAFFAAMARFVGRGNELHIVVGNHDANFHWASVQQRMHEVLEASWGEGRGTSPLGRRVQFHNWFYYEPGLVYIEHGHQYDGFCSFEDPLTPEDPDRPDTLEENLGTAAMRYLGNHLPVDPDAASDLSFVEYLHLVVNAQPDVAYKFVGGYATTVRVLWSQWLTRMRNREQFRERKLRRAARMQAFAREQGLDVQLLERLHRLRRPPVFIDLLQLVRAVMLGRLVSGALLLLVIPLAFPVLIYLLSLPAAIGILVVVLIFVALVHLWLANGRDNVDPTEQMRRSAGKIRRLMNVPFVVFGHSHVPLAHRLRRGGWYFNAGSWAGGGERDHAFTHVLIRRMTGRARASLCRWRAGESRELRSEVTRTSARGMKPGFSTGY